MICNNAKRQEAYDRLRKFLSGRIERALSLADDDLANLSLSQLINVLFLIHGDTGSTGHFNISFATAIELVGTELVWQKPEMEKIPITQFVQ